MPTHPPIQAQNLAELYASAAERFGDRPAFAGRGKEKTYRPVTFGELYRQGLELTTALIELGVQAREHVGLLSDNRLEWILCDCGILLAGAADVPRGSDVTDDDIAYILPHAGVRLTFVENQAVLERVLKNRAKLPELKHIVLMDRETRSADTLHLYDLLEQGRALRAAGDRRAEERIKGIQPSDLFTLIYTSGTTGIPKGVMLSHANMISQVRNIPIRLLSTDRMLSILPVWHIFERVFEMVALGAGCATYYTSVRHFREDLQLAKPTFMASAPRLWESVYQALLGRVEKAPPLRKRLFQAAYFCSRHCQAALRFLRGNALDLKGRSALESALLGCGHLFVLLLLLLPWLALDRLVLKKIRDFTGGCLRGTISGGGALPLHIDEALNDFGIPVLEGYGMTETSPVIAVRRFDKLVIGTVGPLFPETDLRLVNHETGEILYPPEAGLGKKGEIHVRGPQVMRGYYRNPEATAKVLKDGWMNTGDLGVMTFNGCLKIVGRSKDTIVLLGGENVEPVPIESKMLESPLIAQCVVTGQDRKALTALVVPELEQFKASGSSLAELEANPAVREAILKEIKRLVCREAGFKGFELITDCRLLRAPFEVGQELTNLGKIKRHVVHEKFKALIEEMYE